MKITEARDGFLQYILTRKKRSKTTIITYGSNLTQFIAIVGDKAVQNLTVEDIDAYADVLSLKSYAPKTYRNKLNTVRSFVRYLYIKDLSSIKPECVDVPPEGKGKESNYLELEEAQAFMSVIHDVRDRALMYMFLATWGRVSELANLRLEDVYKRTVSIRSGKGDKPRPVFISEEAEAALNAYIAAKRGTEPGLLFPNPDGNPLSRQWIHRRVAMYGAKAGINKKIGPHTLRHTGTTAFLEAGGRLEIAQKILGHTKLETTLVYAHFKDERLHEEYDNIKVSYSIA